MKANHSNKKPFPVSPTVTVGQPNANGVDGNKPNGPKKEFEKSSSPSSNRNASKKKQLGDDSEIDDETTI